ncbi:hypothetical protein ND860_18190 [Leptospira levettii]|uniref:hypothetical protein n=1 Tax=Leptospira levettii TaxID=2023178 RepID=UPI00223D4F46|nr:hypothetical protein [Leptospira levettii]MCW7498472.1 hypothetical protein [Leptospira levettii]
MKEVFKMKIILKITYTIFVLLLPFQIFAHDKKEQDPSGDRFHRFYNDYLIHQIPYAKQKPTAMFEITHTLEDLEISNSIADFEDRINETSFCNIEKLKRKDPEPCTQSEILEIINSRFPSDIRFLYQRWLPKRDERASFARKSCRSKDILALLDFQFHLTKRYDLYEYCIQNVKEMETEVKFQELKREIFEEIKRRRLIVPNLENENTEIKELSEKIYTSSLEALFHYGNFRTYYNLFGNGEFLKFYSLDLLLIDTYPPEKIPKLKSRIHRLTYLKKYLAKKEHEALLRNIDEGILEKNLKLISQISDQSTIILSIPEISKIDKVKLKETENCFKSFNETILKKISLTFYSGFYERYANSYFKLDNESAINPDVVSLVNLYHRETYSGEIFSERLKNLSESCAKLHKVL